MELAFVDDSAQKGHRDGMGKLMSLGAVIFRQEHVASYAAGVRDIYDKLGIPHEVEMKWSPNRGHWLTTAPGKAVRADLYRRALLLAKAMEVRTVVVVFDTGHTTVQGDRAKAQILSYLYERVDGALRDSKDVGILLADKPGGGPREESEWLSGTLELTETGTIYVSPNRIVLPVLTAASDHLPHLQLADLVTSATTAAVSGNGEHVRPLIPRLKDLAHRNAFGYIGGTGLKLYPDNMLNLYYWVFQEDAVARVAFNSGWNLPHARYRRYVNDDGC